MAQPYLTQLIDLVDRLSLQSSVGGRISCKHFFSGAAAYRDDQIFMSQTPVGLALKLGDDDCETLFANGGHVLRYFTKSPVKRGYVILPSAIVEDETKLRSWISRSLDYVGS